MSANKIHKMKVPLFENGVIAFCPSIQHWEDLHRRLKVDGGEELTKGASRTLRHKAHGTLYVIGVFNGKQSTLAHECAHIAFDICSDVGVNAAPGEANETFCYLMSRLVEFCSENMEKTGA